MMWIILVQELRVATAEMSGIVADEDEYRRLDHCQACLLYG